MSFSIQPRILPYSGLLESRSLTNIDLLVVHCTELPDLDTARAYGERILYPDSGTGNSGHYYIDRNGLVEIWVPENRVAHHVRGYNERSIGVELVNRGRFPHWLHSGHQFMKEPYTRSQIDALGKLITDLSARLPSLSLVASHEDLDVDFVPSSDNPACLVKRKRDPGEQFPWPKILAACALKRFRPDES